MGLDTSHGVWNGPYSSFSRFRSLIALHLGLPPLDLMEGFYSVGSAHGDPFWEAKGEYAATIKSRLPIKWEALKTRPVFELLNHSDCEGTIEWYKCDRIAEELEEVLDWRDDDDTPDGRWFKEKLRLAIDGLNNAYKAKENVEFH